MSSQSLVQRVRALLATPGTLKEIGDQIAAAASSLGALKQSGEALQPQIEDLRSQLEVLRLQAEAAKETGDALRRHLSVVRLQIEFMKSRMTTYLGKGVAQTYMEDETPIYVNSHDFGGPVWEVVNGGQYEPNNLDVLLSFVRDDTVFLDIGANLGFFSLQIAKRVRTAGGVHAFEPHPELFRLFCASAFVNGLSSFDGNSGIINIKNIGASDRRARVSFNYPDDHLGGGTLVELNARPHTKVPGYVHPLDSVFEHNFKCDLVKIDVEGHELNVLRGMREILARSPDVKVLYEKLGVGNQGVNRR